jgi:CheY-like chemotaxis protein
VTDPIAILLVEDSPADVELTLRAFQRRKLTNPIAVARDGEEALDYVHRRGAFAESAPVPGLILLDLRLPKMDGLEVLRHIKAHEVYRNIPVVVLTTSAEDRDVTASYELGAASYIVKPVAFENFQDVVERINLYWILTNVPCPVRACGDRPRHPLR